MKLVIVDTGCANISSVYFAFKRLGVEASISSDAKAIKAADKVLLPGVGTAHNAMAKLQQAELIDTLQNLQQPLLELGGAVITFGLAYFASRSVAKGRVRK